VARSLNPLLASLHSSGLGSEQQLLTADGIHSTGKLLVSDSHQLVDGQGRAHGRLFGVGPGTSGWGAGAFARPRTNAAPFRENDALARTVLGVAAELVSAGSASTRSTSTHATSTRSASTHATGQDAPAEPAVVVKA
jgi:hypothetical protein